MHSGRLNERVAIITGAGSGIGRACAQRFAQEGATVVATDIDEAAARATFDMLNAPGCALAHDVTRKQAWQAVVQRVEQRFSHLDVLVNCAGIVRDGTIEDTSLEDWREMLSVNLDGTFFGCQAVVEPMRRAGGGAIVNISSVAGLRGDENLLAYDASKGAVRALTKEVAMHLCNRGDPIRCNSVHPGIIDTPMVRNYFDTFDDPEAVKAAWISAQPAGEMGRAEEVAATVLFLVSDDASFVTGAEYVVDGGMMA